MDDDKIICIIKGLFCACGVAGVACMIWLGVAFIIDLENYSDNNHYTVTVELYGVDMGSEVHGRSSMHRGYIDEIVYYTAFTKTTDGGYELYKIPEASATLYFDLESGTRSYVVHEYDGLGHLVSSKIYLPKDCMIMDMPINAEY